MLLLGERKRDLMALEMMGIDPGLRSQTESLLNTQDQIETEQEIRLA